MKKTKKQKFVLPYSIHYWGFMEVDEKTYYDAMKEGWSRVYGSFVTPDGGWADGSEIVLDETSSHPNDWKNPDATCYDEIDETPPKQIKLFDDEEEEVV